MRGNIQENGFGHLTKIINERMGVNAAGKSTDKKH